jgi:tripartite-type tricarboxylate transporter receptor subunit TctC
MLCAVSPTTVQPQTWPAKPIQVVSTLGTGSTGDTVLRVLAARIGPALGQPLIVEIHSGAAGGMGAIALKRYANDGHALLFGASGTLVYSRHLVKNISFDPQRDYAPVSQVFSTPQFLAVHESLGIGSFKEFVDYARRNPGKLSYGSLGVGSAFHLIGESLKLRTGIDMLHVPYPPANFAQNVTDFATGRVLVGVPSWSVIRQIQGKIRVLAAFDSTRSKRLPEVPHMNELLPGYYNVIPWWGMFGPAGLPRPVADRLAAEIRKTLAEPEVLAKIEPFGISIIASGPDELGAALGADVENIGRLVRELGLKPE